MRPLLIRELEVVARCSAFVIAVCVHVGVLGAFVLAWGGGPGVPILADRGIYQQARLVQAMLLAMLLPWTAARCVADERGDDVVGLAALTAVRPSRLMLARTCAALIALGLVVASGLPVALFAQRMSAAPLFHLFRDQAAMMALAVVACASALGWRYICPSRLLGWMAAEVSTVALVLAALLALPMFAVAACALASLGGATLLLLSVRSDRTLRYLSEHGA